MVNFEQSPQGINIHSLADSSRYLVEEPQQNSVSPMLFGSAPFPQTQAQPIPKPAVPITKDGIKKFVSGLNFQEAISLSSEMMRVANYLKYKELLIRLLKEGDSRNCFLNPVTKSYLVLLEQQGDNFVVVMDSSDNVNRAISQKAATLEINLFSKEQVAQVLDNWIQEIQTVYILPALDLYGKLMGIGSMQEALVGKEGEEI